MTRDVLVTFDRVSENGFNLKVQHWWSGADPRANIEAIHSFNMKVKTRFEAEKLTFAAQDRRMHIVRDPLEPVVPPQRIES